MVRLFFRVGRWGGVSLHGLEVGVLPCPEVLQRDGVGHLHRRQVEGYLFSRAGRGHAAPEQREVVCERLSLHGCHLIPHLLLETQHGAHRHPARVVFARYSNGIHMSFNWAAAAAGEVCLVPQTWPHRSAALCRSTQAGHGSGADRSCIRLYPPPPGRGHPLLYADPLTANGGNADSFRVSDKVRRRPQTPLRRR